MLAHPFCWFCRPSVFIEKVQTEPSSCAAIQPSTDHQFVCTYAQFLQVLIYILRICLYAGQDKKCEPLETLNSQK